MTPRHVSSNSSAPGGGASRRVLRAGQFVLILGAILVGAAVAKHTGAATPSPFVAVDLGTLGGDFSFAYDVNARGQVVGDSFTTGNVADHAFSWTPTGGMIDLGTLGGSSFAVAVSACGQVVGHSYTTPQEEHAHAFSWTPAGGMIDLGTLGGMDSIATAVNARGQVAGFSATDPHGHTVHAFLWTPAGGMIDLGTLGGTRSVARAVNAHGHVVGYSYTAVPVVFHAFSWTPAGGMIDLGTLGGNFSYAYAVNARGDIVGDSTTVAGDHPSPVHAVLWRASATPRRGARADDEVEAGPRVEREAREGDEGGHCHRRGEGRDAEREDD